ncbi:hypothetical protein Emed_000944 [Eimeria media]
MAIREHLYLTLHGIIGLLRGRQSTFKLPQPAAAAAAAAAAGTKQQDASGGAAAAAAAAAAADRQQVLSEGPLVPYDFNWVSALRASRALRAAVQRSIQQQQQQQQQQQHAVAVRELLHQLRYSSLIKRSWLVTHFAIKPLETLLDQLVSLQQQQQQQQQQQAASSSCCRAPTAAELRSVEEASAVFRRAVAEATTAPELVVPAECLEGEGARFLQQLFKETPSGAVDCFARPSHWAGAAAAAVAAAAAAPAAAKAANSNKAVGHAAAKGAPQQLHAALHDQQQQRLQQQRLQQQQQQQQQQRQLQRGQQQSRLTVDEWLAAALRAYGRGLNDLEAAQWFDENEALEQLPQTLAAAYGLRLSFCGFPYRAQVYAVFDEEASLPRGFEPREKAGEKGVSLLSPYNSRFSLRLKIIAHELGHAFKEMLQHNQQEKPVTERPLDFDETFALINE